MSLPDWERYGIIRNLEMAPNAEDREGAKMIQAEYLRIREGYLEERVYLKLADALTFAGYTDQAARKLVEEAFEEARQDFEAAAPSAEDRKASTTAT